MDGNIGPNFKDWHIWTGLILIAVGAISLIYFTVKAIIWLANHVQIV